MSDGGFTPRGEFVPLPQLDGDTFARRQRLIRLTAQGQVISLAEKNDPQRFPDPARADLFGGVARSFPVFEPRTFSPN